MARRTARRQNQMFIERLENRTLLSGSPRIVTFLADNRGQVTLTFDQAMKAADLTTTNFKIYTAGSDGKLGTIDDVAQSVTVVPDSTNRRVTVTASLAANTLYRISVNGNGVHSGDVDNALLDGEFNGSSSVSGDGTAGGTFQFQTQAMGKDIGLFTTSAGMFQQLLRGDLAPSTISNFKNIANHGWWDNTFFHRSEQPASINPTNPSQFPLLQGGGYFINNGSIASVASAHSIGNIPFELGLGNNYRGTIGMASTGAGVGGGCEWYLNVGDNAPYFDPNYGVFGTVTSASGLGVWDALNQYQTISSNGFTKLPIVQQTQSTIYLVLLYRVAMKMNTAAITLQQGAPAAPAIITQNQISAMTSPFSDAAQIQSDLADATDLLA